MIKGKTIEEEKPISVKLISNEQLFEDLKRVAKQTNQTPLGYNTYKKEGKHNIKTLLKRFKTCKDVKSPISFGNSPLRLLLTNLIETTLSFWISTPYQVVTGDFKSHLLIH